MGKASLPLKDRIVEWVRARRKEATHLQVRYLMMVTTSYSVSFSKL